MKVAIVAESFLPHLNGVTNSVLRILDHLEGHGHEAIVVTAKAKHSVSHYGSTPVYQLPGISWPGYADVRLSPFSASHIARILLAFEPDVVHLASPFVTGWSGLKAAKRIGLPVVAVYQTEVTSYAAQYRLPWGAPILRNRLYSIHSQADLNLAPSTAALAQLQQIGVPHSDLWVRGVDSQRFHPQQRSEVLRETWLRTGPNRSTDPRKRTASKQVVVGYAGRLAREKQVQDLAVLHELPQVQLVIVGDGPEAERLQRQLPGAIFTGFLQGQELATALASFDVFVHPGTTETFCQTIQEAFASGVPVIAPRRGGPLDLVSPGSRGYLYDVGDLRSLRNYVSLLIANPELRQQFGSNARKFATTRSWAQICAELVDYYRDLTDDHYPASRVNPRTLPAKLHAHLAALEVAK